MTSAASPWGLYLIMFLAGIGIPTMAALNSGLGARIGDPVLASTFLFVVGLAGSLCLLALQPSVNVSSLKSVPFYFLLGGFFVAFYVFSATFITPRIGVGNVVAFVLLGQLFALATIDHFGLLGAIQFPLTLKRAIGLALMAIGVFLVRKPVTGL